MDFFGIGPLEFFLIVIVALLAVGPKNLPRVSQKLGLMLAQAKRQVAEARESIMAEVDLAETSEKTAPAKPESSEDPPPRIRGHPGRDSGQAKGKDRIL